MTRVAAPSAALGAFPDLLTERGQRLLAQLRDLDPADELTAATRLRRDHPAELVSAAIGQARLRQRAAAKFGRDAERMYFTPHGVEQATRAPVAAWRAARFAELGARRLADLCCGVGGDAIALARAGIEVVAVDRDPLTCAVARANVEALGLADRVEVREAAVEDVPLDGFDALFADPARRGGRGRVFAPEAYSPPLSWALAAAGRAPLAALKVAPGVPHEAVPAEAAAEWVSHRGEVKEAVLWFGTGEREPRRATLLPGCDTLAGSGARRAPAGEPGRYLYEPDGAVIRAHLVAEVAEAIGGRLLDPEIAYVTADAPAATPFATGYELTDVLPFNVKRLRALLRERDVGTVTVKKRGSALTPEELIRRLKPRGPGAATVFLTRVADEPAMLLSPGVLSPRPG
ncbi:methyltransferase domain-containing protein [Streptomyces sp. 8K308]|uniref:class I SAM-dependent methyltransferase n=1 Tax=Streptomyces sp. 8K308 TaxID=2530388 RepID=UPI00104F2995|nr:methyltransferase domain-containing protein [Streptomyces sp. 8K308]TDC23139.1 methyltransferase domain-containing protein [Streptomyces sp. 8K308]